MFSNYNLNGVWFCIAAMDIVTIEIWHGGEVEVLPHSTRYVGGQLFVKKKKIDHDCLGIMEFFGFLEDLGYLNVNHFYYKFPGNDFEVGPKVLQSDGDLNVMVEKIKMEGHSVVQVYVERDIDPIIEDECPLRLPAAPNVPPPQSQHTTCG